MKSRRRLRSMMPDSRTLDLIATRCALCHSTESAVQATGSDFEYDTADNEFHMVACRGCGHVYLDPRPSSDDLGAIYPSNYYSFVGTRDGLVARAQRVWESGKVKLYRELIGGGPKRILDVGCGDGRLLSLLEEFGDPDWTLAGLEFDEAAVARCRALGFEAFALRVEDFAALPEQQANYDAVVMLQLIEHVDDPVLVCERVFSLLRPGGVFIIETPDLDGLDYRLFKKRWWGHYHFPRHWNLFSRDSLVRMLAERGFEIARAESLISTSAWIISLHNYFKDKRYPDFVWKFFSYKNPLLLGLFVVLDSIRSRLGWGTSNQRVIGRKPGAEAGAGAAPQSESHSKR